MLSSENVMLHWIHKAAGHTTALRSISLRTVCNCDHTSNLVQRFHCTFTGCFLLYIWSLYNLLLGIYSNGPMPVATRSKAWVCGRSATGMAGLNPAGGHGWLTCGCCVLLGGGPCDGPITRPEAYRVWCVCYFETSTGRPEPNMAVEAREKKLQGESRFTLTALNRLKHSVYYI